MTDTLRKILALARAGSISRAWDFFVAEGLAEVSNDPAVLTLNGRLLKDRARKAQGETRAQLYWQSAQAYSAAAALKPDSYPLINAATVSLFAATPDQMASLARQVLSLLETGNGAGETPYWHDATKAEALLLLGQRAGAETALRKAITYAPQAWEDHATTLRQFRAILEYRNEAHDWLAAYAPPKSIYFKGMMGIAADDRHATDAIATLVAKSGARFAFGALAAGADIMIADAVSCAGGDLHVILPVVPDAFKKLSVEPYGEHWLRRFDALFEQAASVEIVDNSEHMSSASIQLAAAVAKGRAIDNASRLESAAVPVEVTDQTDRLPHELAVLTLSRSATPDRTIDLEDRQISILLATDGAAAQQDTLFTQHGATAIAVIGSAQEALDAVRRLRAASAEASVAVHIVIADGDMVKDADVVRLRRLVQAAVRGTTIATAAAAMMFKATEPDLEIEPLGELPDPSRALGIYALGIYV